jgi:hypothetical protein
MSGNKIENAIAEIIGFLKEFFTSIILFAYNPKKLLSEKRNISPQSLVLLSCFIYSITIPYLDGEFISDLFVKPLAYFETIKQISNTSIIQSFILSIPYFLLTYMLGKILTFLLFKKENRSTFQKIFYYYIFWMLMINIIMFSLLAFWGLIYRLDNVHPTLEYAFGLIFHDWVGYSLFIIPIINILIRFYGVYKKSMLSLIFFAVALYYSHYCFMWIADFRNYVVKSNTRENIATPVLFFSGDFDENNIYVEFTTPDSVLLTGKLVLSNPTNMTYYCSRENTIMIETHSDSNYVNITLDVSDYPLNSFNKIEANSLEKINVSRLISAKDWKSYESHCNLNKNKAVYQLGVFCEGTDFDSFDGTYSLQKYLFYGDYEKHPIIINFIKK